MTIRSIHVPETFNETPSATIIQHPNAQHQNPVYPFAKKAGFTNRLLASVRTAIQYLTSSIRKYIEYRQDRIIAIQFLSMGDEILDDLALTRGDINYVLATKSPALATERLRLMSVERRAGQKTDFRRRAKYLDELTPCLPPATRGDRQIEKLTG